jgi:hypothetical protein
MSRMPFETVLQPAFSVKPCSGPVPDVGNGSTTTAVAGNAEPVPDAVAEYEKLPNVRPLAVEKVFPFDTATTAVGVEITVEVSPGSSRTGRVSEPARASRAPMPETRSPAAIDNISERVFIRIS